MAREWVSELIFFFFKSKQNSLKMQRSTTHVQGKYTRDIPRNHSRNASSSYPIIEGLQYYKLRLWNWTPTIFKTRRVAFWCGSRIFILFLSYLLLELIVYSFWVLVSNQVYQYFYLKSIIGPSPLKLGFLMLIWFKA